MGSDGGILGVGGPELVRVLSLSLLDVSLSPSLSSHSNHTSLVPIPISLKGHNPIGRLLCLGTFRLVQVGQGSWKVCAKL